MEERMKLIAELDAAREDMRATIQGMDPQREIYPGWTLKHILAHLAGWDEAVAASLRAYTDNSEPGTPATEGIDAYNAQSVATRQALSLEQVTREWELARDEVKELLLHVPAERFSETLLYPWGRRGSLQRFIRIFVDHEREHAEEIRALVRQREG